MIVITQAPVQPRLPVTPYRAASMLVPSSAEDISMAMPQTTPNVIFQPLQGHGVGELSLDDSKKKLLFLGVGALAVAALVGYFVFRK